MISFLPSGADVSVEAGRIRVPVGLTYDTATGDLYVTMNQRDDLGDATPGDWLAIVRPGQDWGFPDCYGQGGSACDGVPAPVALLDKHAAVSGLAIVDGELGAGVGKSALVAEWSTGSVLRGAQRRWNRHQRHAVPGRVWNARCPSCCRGAISSSATGRPASSTASRSDSRRELQWRHRGGRPSFPT